MECGQGGLADSASQPTLFALHWPRLSEVSRHGQVEPGPQPACDRRGEAQALKQKSIALFLLPGNAPYHLRLQESQLFYSVLANWLPIATGIIHVYLIRSGVRIAREPVWAHGNGTICTQRGGGNFFRSLSTRLTNLHTNGAHVQAGTKEPSTNRPGASILGQSGCRPP